MAMNIHNGLKAGCCNPESRCLNANAEDNISRFCCDKREKGCCCSDDRDSRNRRPEFSRRSEPRVHADIRIFCIDEDCNGLCNCVFELYTADGRCRTIDLRNCDRSGNIFLPDGCNVLRNITVPKGFIPLYGDIICEVGRDSFDRRICTVSADRSLDGKISVKREIGITNITLKFQKSEGFGFSDGCECSGL